MLKKKVCEECINKHYEFIGWDVEHEWDWLWDGKIYCPQGGGRDNVETDVHGEPPRYCPYKLEHLVLNELVH